MLTLGKAAVINSGATLSLNTDIMVVVVIIIIIIIIIIINLNCGMFFGGMNLPTGTIKLHCVVL